MASIHFDKFNAGLDHRKSADTAGADSLRELTNAYITTGQEIAKRSCALSVATLEAGTRGLWSALGVLNTFYAAGTISHGDPQFEARFVPHPTDSARTVSKIHYCDAFRGYLYIAVEYDDGSVWHHYLDGGSADRPEWESATAYVQGDFVVPTVANGYCYEATSVSGTGTSDSSEPTWPTTVGDTVTDNAGANQITWTCRAFTVADSNCPHSKSVTKVGGKLYAIDGDVVRFCAVADARDWTAASDAGFLATGDHQDGTSEALAVAQFKHNLAVFFADGVQVWEADPDPDLTILIDKAFNTGCRYPRSIGNVSQDTIFLSDNGFRSIALAVQSDTLEDTDIGSPIDDLVRPHLAGEIAPFSVWFAPSGQFWCVMGSVVWVYTYSRTSKVKAWSRFAMPFAVDDATVLNGKLYLREGNNVYRVDENTHQDGPTAPQVVIEFPLLDFKSPGALKIIQGVDFVGRGTVSLSYRYLDEAGALHETEAVEVTGNTMPGVLTPVELCVTAIAPRIVHQANEAFRLSRLTFYFDVLNAA